MIYLDYAATTPVDKRVLEAMLPYFADTYANPSSKHSCGRRAARAVKAARQQVADALGCHPEDVIFTGGASEASNMAIKGIGAQYDEPMHFITSEFEHKATLEAIRCLEAQGHDVTIVSPECSGVVPAQAIADAIREDTVMVSLIHVNNEIGTIQPIEEVGRICDENDIVFHVDATQSFGKMPVDVDSSCIDLLSLSAHKVYGPKGIGALYLNPHLSLECLISGGSQEGGLRAGTLNVPGIVGLGEAAEIAQREMKEEWERLEDLETGFLQVLQDRIGNVHIQGDRASKVPWISNVCFEGIDGELLRDALCAAEICVSRSSACAKSNAASHVLQSIQCPEELMGSAIRFSFGRLTNFERLQIALETLEELIMRMRSGEYDMRGACPF